MIRRWDFLFDGAKKFFIKSCHKIIFRAYNEVKRKIQKKFLGGIKNGNT